MAKTFLEATDAFYKIASSNTSVFGSGVKEQISLASDIVNITVDSNVDSLQLLGNQADYQFLQQGNTLKILQNNVLITQLGVQDDDDGSQLAFADKTVSAKFAFDMTKGGLYFDLGGVAVGTTPVTISNTPIPETNNSTPQPTPPEIPTSTLNYEIEAPFIYQSNNLQNLDSITALLSYSPTPQNGVNYSDYEPSQWRTRASSQELAVDLTQTTTPTNQVILQGQLDPNTNAQTWYKIQLTQPSNLQVQDLSSQSDLVDVAVFPDSGQNSLSYSYSLYDATKQLNSYENVPAGNYFVRIDKNNSATTQQPNFKVLINTQNSDDFILPLLNFDTQNSLIHAELSAQSSEQFYKFSLLQNSSFTLDTTLFAKQFDINLVQPNSKGGYSGVPASYFLNAPDKLIYEPVAGTYYLKIKPLTTLTTATKLDIPVISDTPVNFNTSFENTAPNVLKADLVNAKPAISTDTTGNLELTYTFDLSKILGTDDASPNATPFSDTQKQAARLALQDYENIAKLKFRELPAGSSEKAQFTFTNVSSLGDAAGEASTQQSNTNDYSRVTVRIDASKIDASSNFAVGSNDYATLLHEIGHALGLKHPRSYGSGGADSELPFLTTEKDSTQHTIMSYNQPTYLLQDGYDLNKNPAAVAEKTPLLYDIAAMQKLYGANQNYNSNDTVYRWDKDTDPHMSIWDGGGIDTIDASNHSQKQVIDLRVGAFSSIGAVTLRYTNNSTELYASQNNVSIAFDTIIENAIGSNQDDVIIGNSVANQLTGNGGKDSFVFASKLSDFNVDTITGFNAVDDVLILDRAIFNALSANNVLSEQELFVSASATIAENAVQRIVFNTTSQSLYYDADGAGGENALLFALLPNLTMLNASQIFIQG